MGRFRGRDREELEGGRVLPLNAPRPRFDCSGECECFLLCCSSRLEGLQCLGVFNPEDEGDVLWLDRETIEC